MVIYLKIYNLAAKVLTKYLIAILSIVKRNYWLYSTIEASEWYTRPIFLSIQGLSVPALEGEYNQTKERWYM